MIAVVGGHNAKDVLAITDNPGRVVKADRRPELYWVQSPRIRWLTASEANAEKKIAIEGIGGHA
jgi:hypothetical protein